MDLDEFYAQCVATGDVDNPKDKDEDRLFDKAGNLTKRNLSADQVAWVLSKWGERHEPPYNLHLGVVMEGESAFLLDGASEDQAIIVWIYNDNVARATNNLLNHY